MSKTIDPASFAPVLRQVEAIPFREEGSDMVLLRDPEGFSEEVLAVSTQVLQILTKFDGSKTLEDIRSEIHTPDNSALPLEILTDIIEKLRKHHLLLDEEFLQFRRGKIEEFHKRLTREMTLAASGYPEDRGTLAKLLESYLAAPPPEDFEPEEIGEGEVRGLLAPHIDFNRGGECYGRGYREWVKRLPPPEAGPLLIGIIGVAHSGANAPIVLTAKDFMTPFGLFLYDRPAIEELHALLGAKPFEEEWLHRNEHSVEFHAIWLSYLLQDREVTFLPILAGNLDTDESNLLTPRGEEALEASLNALMEVEARHQGPVLWVAAVDFSHIGPRFGDDEPVNDSICRAVEKQDMRALEALRSCDAESWWKNIMKDGNARRVCGLSATYLALRLLAGSKGIILDYQQAVSSEHDQMVSFTTALFERTADQQ